MDPATAILAQAVIDAIMACEVVMQIAVLTRFIGENGRFDRNVLAKDRNQRRRFQILHNHAFCSASITVNQRQYLALVAVATADLFALFVAEKRFVHFDRADQRQNQRCYRCAWLRECGET